MYPIAAIFFVRTDEKEINQMRITLTPKHFLYQRINQLFNCVCHMRNVSERYAIWINRFTESTIIIN